jgi:V-type H+-transporting ATPase subunit a
MLKKAKEGDPCYLTEPMYAYQDTVQLILLALMIVCIPWMLLIKPFYLRHTHNKK